MVVLIDSYYIKNANILNKHISQNIISMIIQNNGAYLRDQEQLAREVEEYKKINASLKKKIHARDKKITYLFSCLDQMSKSSVQTIESPPSQIHKNQSQIDYKSLKKRDIALTEKRKKQKQNVNQNHQNLFKDKEQDILGRLSKENVKFPALQRKSGLFDEGSDEPLDSKPRMVKVSLEKLIPLKHEDIKRRFQNKYK